MEGARDIGRPQRCRVPLLSGECLAHEKERTLSGDIVSPVLVEADRVCKRVCIEKVNASADRKRSLSSRVKEVSVLRLALVHPPPVPAIASNQAVFCLSPIKI